MVAGSAMPRFVLGLTDANASATSTGRPSKVGGPPPHNLVILKCSTPKNGVHVIKKRCVQSTLAVMSVLATNIDNEEFPWYNDEQESA